MIMIILYDSKQVIRSMPTACCSSDDSKWGSRGEEMKNYDVCNTGRFRRYEEGNVGDAKPATAAHNCITD